MTKVYPYRPKFIQNGQCLFTLAKVYSEWPKFIHIDQCLLTLAKVYSRWPKFIYIDQSVFILTKVYSYRSKFIQNDQSLSAMSKVYSEWPKHSRNGRTGSTDAMAHTKQEGENDAPTILVPSHACLRRAGVSRCSGGASHYPPSQRSPNPNTPKSLRFPPKWYAGATDSRIPPPWVDIYYPVPWSGFLVKAGTARHSGVCECNYGDIDGSRSISISNAISSLYHSSYPGEIATDGPTRHLNRKRPAVFTIARYTGRVGAMYRSWRLATLSPTAAAAEGFRRGERHVAISERQFSASYTSLSIWAMRVAHWAVGIKRSFRRAMVLRELNPRTITSAPY